MDFDELEKNLDHLMSLNSVKEDLGAQSVIRKIKSSINSEKRFANESESTQFAINILESCEINRASETAVKILGLEQNTPNTNFLNLIHPDHKNEILCSLSSTNHPTLRECPLMVRGEYKWFQIMIIFNEEDEQYRLLITDINDRLLQKQC